MVESKTESRTRTTIDRDEIRRWVEEHGGEPAAVRGTQHGEDDPGVLRIGFPGGTGEDQLERASWDEWFRELDENGPAFLHQEQKADSRDSTFSELVEH
jgi:hypothetical protein